MTSVSKSDDNLAFRASKPMHVLLVGALLGAISGSLSGAGPLYQLSMWFRGVASVRSHVPEWVQLVFYEPLTFPAPFVFFAAVAAMFVIWDGWPVRRLAPLFPIIALAWIPAFLLAYVVVLSFDQHAFVGLSSPNVEGCPSSIFGTPIPVPDASSDQKPSEVCAEFNRYRDQIEPIFRRLSVFVYISAGVAAGLVGSLFTALGLALVSHRHRSVEAVVLIVLVGTVAGAALGWETEGRLALFVIWQTAVAAAIARPFAAAFRPLHAS